MPDNDNKKYLDLITQEYYNKEKFYEITKSLLDFVSPAFDMLGKFWEYFDLNTAVGNQLDVIGQYFHLNRLLPDIDRDVVAKSTIFGYTDLKSYNLLPSARRKFEDWSIWAGRTITLTQGRRLDGVGSFFVDNATQMNFTATDDKTNHAIYYYTVRGGGVPNEHIYASCYVQNLNSFPIAFSTNLTAKPGSKTGSSVSIPGNSSKFCELDFINTAPGSNYQLKFATVNDSDLGKACAIIAALPYGSIISNREMNSVDFIAVRGFFQIFNQNLLDINKAINHLFVRNPDGTFTFTRSSTGRFSEWIPFYMDANIPFCFSMNTLDQEVSGGSTTALNIRFRYTDGTEGNYGRQFSVGAGIRFLNFILPQSATAAQFYLNTGRPTGAYIKFENMQAILGNYSNVSSVPSYKPYNGQLIDLQTSIYLNGIDETSRDMMVINKEGSVDITKNILLVKFTGNETNWTMKALSNGVYQFAIPYTGIVIPSSSEVGKIVSKSFFTISYDQSNSGEIGVAISPTSEIVFTTSIRTSLDDWKNWLKSISSGLENLVLANAATVTHIKNIIPIELGIDDITTMYLSGTPAPMSIDVFKEVYEGTQIIDIDYHGIPKVLTDDLYRLILQSRVYQYHWDGTIKGLYEIFNALFPDVILWLQDNGDMSYTMTVMTTELPPYVPELFTLGYITPKPAGIRVNYVMYERPFFSWDLDEMFYKGWDQAIWL